MFISNSEKNNKLTKLKEYKTWYHCDWWLEFWLLY